jgi:hypothetical protein
MRRILLFIVTAAIFSSCYKNECHSCVTRVTRNGVAQSNTLEKIYCGLSKKELREKEKGSELNYFDSTMMLNVYELTLTDCD